MNECLDKSTTIRVCIAGAVVVVALMLLSRQYLFKSKAYLSPDMAIRDKNSEIGLFTVLEVVTKDAVYLKYRTVKGLDLMPYEVVWGHRGVLEYVVDLSKAKVERLDDKTGRLESIVVTVPKPYLDEKTLNPVLDTIENQYEANYRTHTDEAMGKVKAVAKKAFRDNLQHIAALGFDAEASQATRKALVAMYKSIDSTVPVKVVIEETK